jgi:hypothetical protein
LTAILTTRSILTLTLSFCHLIHSWIIRTHLVKWQWLLSHVLSRSLSKETTLMCLWVNLIRYVYLFSLSLLHLHWSEAF